MKERIIKAIKFFWLSGIGWIIDMIIYTTLSNIIAPWIANIISSFVAITFVFVTSTKKIFINKDKYSLKLKYIAYIIYQIILVAFSSYIIAILINWLDNIDFIMNIANILAKIIVTPFTMIINYIVMNNLIEKI